MSDDVKLTLPPRKVKIDWGRSPVLWLLAAAVALGAANLAFALIAGSRGAKDATAVLSAGEQRDLALKLEEQGLGFSAVEAWKTYLVQASPAGTETAAVWYRIGKIQQEQDRYEEALESYYRSEALHKDASTEKDIGRRVQECLEASGRYAALRQELSRRAGQQEDSAESGVVAEVAGEKITGAGLERKIEEAIRLETAPYAPYMSAEDLARRKEELFKQYATREAKEQFLNQYLAAQMLYLSALDDKLADDAEVRGLLKDAERQVLASSALNRAMADNIKITESDVSTYFQANKARYVEDGKQKGFEEVRDKVYADLRDAKAKEVQGSVLEGLRKKYDVVVHPSLIVEGEAGSTDAGRSK